MKNFNQFAFWKIFTASPGIEIQKKLLAHLYKNTQKTLLALLILAIILSSFLKESVPGYLLYTWLSIVVALTLHRLYDGYRYLHNDYSHIYQKWQNKFAFEAYITAFLWGSTIFFIPYINDPYLELMIYLFIMGIGGGAANSFSPSLRIAFVYTLILFLPMFFHFFLMGTTTGYALSVPMVIYYYILLNISQNAEKLLIASYGQAEKDKITYDALYTKQEELNSLFKNAPVGVFYYDTDFKIIDYNKAFADLFETDMITMKGMDLNLLPDQRPVTVMKSALSGGTHCYSGPYRSINGVNLWIEAKSSSISNDQGEVLGGIVLLENKTAEKKAQDELNYMARHDALTSLANRRSFMEYMQQLVKKNEHQDRYSVLFYLDLNQFKTINDSMGHSVGDQLLVQVANRLQSLLKEGYNLSRLGGDEFVIVLPFIAGSKKDAKTRADMYSHNIQEVFTKVFLIEEMHLYIKSSIGIVIIEPQSYNIEEIVRYADISMYNAKRKGRDTIAYYNPRLDAERKELFSLQHDLHHAIENNQLKLYYQPIVTIDDDTLKAAEALIRWEHPTLGLLAPAQFLPLASESGLIDDIGWLVINIVCHQITEWKEQSLFTLDYISINIDAIQLQRSNFVEKFFAVLDHCGVQANEIKLEITESSLIDNFEQTQEIIQTLKSRGIRCAIDDFGTGYSSLSYLQKFSFSVLKIDREFIKDILDKPKNIFLVESIIAIGKKLGYRIVVEGIETEEQKELLKGIDNTLRYQGFLFSKPLSPGEFKDKFCIKC